MDWSGGSIASATPRSQSPAPTLRATAPFSDRSSTSQPGPSLLGKSAMSSDEAPTKDQAASSSAAAAPPSLASASSVASTTHSDTNTTNGNVPALPVTLEQELTNVMAGLGSFWGKVRKQSVNALAQAEKQIESARKDLTPLVTKARANLDQLGESTRAELQRLTEEAGSGTNSSVVIGADGMPILIDEVTDQSNPVAKSSPQIDVKGKKVDRSPDVEGLADALDTEPADATATAATASPDAIAASATAFFNKVQSQLASNPNLQGLSKNLATLQNSVSTNLSSLPTSLQTNIHQLQTQFAQQIDLTDTQKTAEGYLHKGESWLVEFGNEVSRLAKEAIHVVPPGEAALSTERAKKREDRLRKAEQVAGGRRETYLRRLRTDPSLLLDDPAQPPPLAASAVTAGTTTTTTTTDETDAPGETMAESTRDTREAFARFLQSIEDRGGFEAEAWKAQIRDELEAAGEALEGTVRLLVPAKLTSEALWSRYFFRVAEIDEDEMRRRQVLQGAETNEDDFSWDMEDEDEDEDEAGVPSSVAKGVTAPTTLTSSIDSTGATPLDTSRTQIASSTNGPLAAAPTGPGLAAQLSMLSRASSVSAGSDWGLDVSTSLDESDGGPTPPVQTTTSTSTSMANPAQGRTAAMTTMTTTTKGASAETGGGAAVTTTSPRTSSDGTAASYDFVGRASGTPSERDEDASAEEGATRAAAVGEEHAAVPNARTKVPLGEKDDEASDDSDWE